MLNQLLPLLLPRRHLLYLWRTRTSPHVATQPQHRKSKIENWIDHFTHDSSRGIETTAVPLITTRDTPSPSPSPPSPPIPFSFAPVAESSTAAAVVKERNTSSPPSPSPSLSPSRDVEAEPEKHRGKVGWRRDPSATAAMGNARRGKESSAPPQTSKR